MVRVKKPSRSKIFNFCDSTLGEIPKTFFLSSLKCCATVVQFARFEVGEGIEKKAELSFAEEVAAAQAAAK